jgi:hypothetical protein
VKVDGRTIGTSPIRQVELPAGPHDLRVVKDGFIDWARTIQIKPHELQAVDVTIIPSAKFIDSYESRAKSFRRWAWIAAASCLALEGTALGLRLFTWQKYDSIESNYDKGIYAPYSNQSDYYNHYKDDMQRAEIMDYAALGLSLAGVLAGAASLYLFLEGDDPGRYQQFHGLLGGASSGGSGVPSVSLGLGALDLSWAF